MISPSNTYNGLTTSGAGTEPGEPDKYYPTGGRNYFRLLPNDHVQAAALVTAAARPRLQAPRRSLHDGEVYGRGIATDARATAAAARPRGRAQPPHRAAGAATTARSRARRSARSADCVVYGGITANGAVQVFKDLAARAAEGAAVRQRRRRRVGLRRQLPKSVARRTHVDRRDAAEHAYGLKATDDPYKAFGYEAMKVILDGINAVGPDRAALINWLHTVQNRPSAIGDLRLRRQRRHHPARLRPLPHQRQVPAVGGRGHRGIDEWLLDPRDAPSLASRGMRIALARCSPPCPSPRPPTRRRCPRPSRLRAQSTRRRPRASRSPTSTAGQRRTSSRPAHGTVRVPRLGRAGELRSSTLPTSRTRRARSRRATSTATAARTWSPPTPRARCPSCSAGRTARSAPRPSTTARRRQRRPTSPSASSPPTPTSTSCSRPATRMSPSSPATAPAPWPTPSTPRSPAPRSGRARRPQP